jgi:hypothetical protein
LYYGDEQEEKRMEKCGMAGGINKGWQREGAPHFHHLNPRFPHSSSSLLKGPERKNF